MDARTQPWTVDRLAAVSSLPVTVLYHNGLSGVASDKRTRAATVVLIRLIVKAALTFVTVASRTVQMECCATRTVHRNTVSVYSYLDSTNYTNI